MTATIKSSTGGQYTLDDIRWEVRDEIEAAQKGGQTSGTIECAGSTYRWTTIARVQTIARCVEPDCNCDDRHGVILYDGPDEDEAKSAASQAPTGYAIEIVTIPR